MAWHARTEAAEPTNDEIDWHAGPRSLAQGFDHVRVFQLIHLGDNASGATVVLILNFAMDEIKQPRPHGKWSDQERCAVGLVCVSSQIVEEIDDISCNPMVARE